MTSDALLVFLKTPRPGTVKTRLAASLGDDDATALYRALTEAVVSNTTPRDGAYTRVLHVWPADGVAGVRRWFPDERIVPQRGGDLGERMAAAFADAFADGAERVVVIGTDLPWLDGTIVRDALERCADDRVVIGPAADGGYYLLGLGAPYARLFAGVPWSTPSVRAETEARARGGGLGVDRLATRRDIDTIDDVRDEWHRLRGLLDPALAVRVERALSAE